LRSNRPGSEDYEILEDKNDRTALEPYSGRVFITESYTTMVSPNRSLLITFIVLAIGQTAFPILAQRMSQAIVYHGYFRAAIAACVATAVAVTVYQTVQRRFGAGSIIAFYGGLGLLVAYDIWIEGVVEASV